MIKNYNIKLFNMYIWCK